MGPKNDWRDRLEAFYKHYQPDKLSGVPSLLKKIDGNPDRFDKLLSQLINKYGPEPVAPPKPPPKESGGEKKERKVVLNEKLRDRVYTFYDHYNKDKLDTVENLVLRTKNKTKYEKRLLKMLVDKYGPEPDQNSFKSRLIRYYSKYQPSKLSSVDNLVKKAGDSIQQQEQLFRMLVSKYGPEPDLEDAVTSAMENLAIDNEEEDEDDDEEDEDEGNPLFRKVVYCPVDGMPPEYSEYLTTFDDCLPWLLENKPNLKLTTRKGMTVKEYVESIKNDDGEVEASKSKSRGGAARPNKNIKNKKKTKENDKIVTIERVNRSKKKYITVVIGLDTFDIKLKEAAKKLGKKFACSASVNKLPGGGQSVDIQGDVCYDLPDVILEYYPSVDKTKMYSIEDGRKNKVFDD